MERLKVPGNDGDGQGKDEHLKKNNNDSDNNVCNNHNNNNDYNVCNDVAHSCTRIPCYLGMEI